jgi:hypothetical protein
MDCIAHNRCNPADRNRLKIIDAERKNCDKNLKELKAIPHPIRARMLY